MRRSLAKPLALAVLLATAQASAAPERQPRIFDDDAPLAIDLEADWSAVRQERSKTPEAQPATLSYSGPAGLVSIPLRVETRGRSRLLRDVCDFPPLRLDFEKSASKGTLFRGIGELKLVTHCQKDPDYEQFLLLEYLIYRAYGLLAEHSYRVRLLRVRYREPGAPKPRWQKLGFVIEDAAQLAERIGAERVAESRIDPSEIERGAASRVELFFYLIGMTDFSMSQRTDGPCCHNVRMLRLPSGALAPIPYDFDQTGVVDPPYALPSPSIGIQSVRQRRFRGLCRPPEETEGTLALLREKRPAIRALFDSQGELTSSRRKKALKFLDGFYEWADDPARVRKTLAESCRKVSS